MKWMIYGANGYTGELIAREAVSRGLRPVLAGRSGAAISELSRELGCEHRVFALDDRAAVVDALRDADVVLHCAGPFTHTARPMIEGCLQAHTDYLDITGEIEVFESVFARDAAARERDVLLLPGVGFDVVPSDCLAASLARALPSATELILAFDSRGGRISRGTMKTMVENIDRGGAVRRDGKIVSVPTAFDVRDIPFRERTRTAMTIPWGDVSTAFHSTGIPNIRVYFAASPRLIRRLRLSRAITPLLGLGPIKRLLLARAEKQEGPGESERAAGRVDLYGRVEDAQGHSVTATMTTPDGYAFTVLSALEAVERLRDGAHRAGAFTPSRLFGAEFAQTIPGVQMRVGDSS